MRINVNQLVYDDADALCKCILSESQGNLYAFIQCVDTGMDGNARYTARYWGAFSHDDTAGSIKKILANGGKWPSLPG